jgi:hypothetical protein
VDYDFWRANLGATSGTGLNADGNGNGIVDSADYVLWRKLSTPTFARGDYNHDGNVSALDYGTWRANFGATSGTALSADGNTNGSVDAADYVIWRKRSNTGAATAATTAVENGVIAVPDRNDPASTSSTTLTNDALKTGAVHTTAVRDNSKYDAIGLALLASRPSIAELRQRFSARSTQTSSRDIVTSEQGLLKWVQHQFAVERPEIHYLREIGATIDGSNELPILDKHAAAICDFTAVDSALEVLFETLD